MLKQIVLSLVIFCGFVSQVHLVQDDPPCGVKGPPAVDRLGIVGGNEAGEFEFPWQLTVFRYGIVNCGASILNSLWVITAAQCVSDYLVDKRNWNELEDSNKVFVGTFMINASTGQPKAIFEIDKIIFHPNYFTDTSGEYNIPVNDVALLKLKYPLPLSDPSKHYASICLPKDHSSDHYLAGTVCTITGRGRTSSGGDLSPTLQRANVTIQKQESCFDAYSGVAKVYLTMICAADLGRSFCRGDGGGPMICYDEGKWNLVGIISWQNGCADPNYPGVYTRVTQFVPWIKETIAND